MSTPQKELKTNLYGKAVFLEETLRKMQNFEYMLYKVSKYDPKKREKFEKEFEMPLELKLKDLRRGIWEVYNKCISLWTEISLEDNTKRKGT